LCVVAGLPPTATGVVPLARPGGRRTRWGPLQDGAARADEPPVRTDRSSLSRRTG